MNDVLGKPKPPTRLEDQMPTGPLFWIAPNPDIIRIFEEIHPGYGKLVLDQWAEN